MKIRIVLISVVLWIFSISTAAGLFHTGNVRSRSSHCPTTIYKSGSGEKSGFDTLCVADFEKGKIPDDWSVVQTAPPNDTFPVNWFVTTNDDSIAIGNGNFLIWVNYSIKDIQDEWLKTPILNLNGYSSDIYLNFLRIYNTPDPWADSATVYVRVSLDGGTTWPDTVYSVNKHDTPGRIEVEIRLDEMVPECIGRDSVVVGFEYSGRNGDSAGLDDIVVRAYSPQKVMRSGWGEIKARYLK